MRYDQVHGTEIMVHVQQMQTPSSFLSLHPQVICFQKCKPVPTLEPTTNRWYEGALQLIQHPPKAK